MFDFGGVAGQVESGNFPGKDFGEFVELLVVQQGEGLEWRVGADTAGAGAEAVGSIEDSERGMRGGAPEMGVEEDLGSHFRRR